MRASYPLAILAILLLFIIGCGQQDAERWKNSAEAESGSLEYEETVVGSPERPDPRQTLSSTAARAFADTSRKFIHTADLRFRTKDLVQSTFQIEALVARFDGYVANTTLNSHVDHVYTTPISADSLLETTKYTVTNRVTIRIPSAKLDTTLKSLIQHVDFLDHRTITATDVQLMLLGNRMTTERVAKHEERVTEAIDEQGKKLRETVTAEEKLLDCQEQADKARMQNLELQDRIAFSTITLDLYQRQDIRREVLANEQNIERYEPGFFSQVAEALENGWELLLSFLVFLAGSWSVVLIGIGAFLLLRRLFRRAR